jgi:hypothetical protein
MMSGRRCQRGLEFLLDGKALQIVDEFRYLGAITSRDGSWSKHVASAVQSCRAKSIFVSSQLQQLGSMSCFTAITLWKTLCRPLLEYGLESAVLSDDEINELDQVQFEFFRCALQMPAQTPRCFLFAALGIRSMGERLERLRVGLAFDILYRMEENRYPRKLFLYIQQKKWDVLLPWFQGLYGTLGEREREREWLYVKLPECRTMR